MRTLKLLKDFYLGIPTLPSLRILDESHIPDNKLPGQVKSVLDSKIVRNPVKGWTEISMSETTFGKKTITKSISMNLTSEQTEELIKYLIENRENQLPSD